MGINGLLTDVRWEWTGTEVTANLVTGTTVLPVLDPEAITEGENVWIAGTGPYEILETDVDAVTFTITPGLTIDIDSETEIATDIGGQPGRAWVCEVVLADADEPVEVPLTVHDLAVMPEGTYDPPVGIVLSDDLERVENLPGALPVIDGTYIPPESLPPALPPELSDGNPPVSSPQPEVISGIGAFYLRWTPPSNADPLRFEVHVSAESGFTPSAETMYSETGSYSMTLRHLASIDEVTGKPFPFAYDVPYYFRIIAKDADGAAPAGNESSGVLTRIIGPDIAAQTVTAENIVVGTLTGDLFEGNLFMGSTITTGAMDPTTGEIMGSRVELGPNGFRIVDAAGTEITKFPLDSLDTAFVKGHFEMLSAEVQDNFTMRGTNNQVATGSEITLASGVSPPTAPPTLMNTYDTVQLDTATLVDPGEGVFGGSSLGAFALNGSQIRALAWDRNWTKWVVLQQRSNGYREWRFNGDGSIALNNGQPWVADWLGKSEGSICWGYNGIAHLHKTGADYYIWGVVIPDGSQGAINRIPSSWILDAAGRAPMLGFDATQSRYMLAQTVGGASGTLHVRRFSLVAGSNYPPAVSNSVTSNFEAGSGYSTRTNGIVYGLQANPGANRYVFTSDGFVQVDVFNTSGTWMNDEGTYEGWNKPVLSLGFCHTDTQFASIDSSGKITLYTNWTWPQVSTTIQIGTSAFDSDVAGSQANPHVGQTAGQHETPVGAFSSFSQARRAKLQITVPETNDSGLPDDPDKWKVYFARQDAVPTAGSQLKLAATLGSPTASTAIVLTADPTGVAPPGGISGEVGAVNNFPGADPGRVESAVSDALGPMIQLLGSGAGRLGPYSWDKDGNVTGSPVPPGVIQMYAGATAPVGWLICDGTAISRTLYSRLYAVLSTTFGTGDGSTTFNLPNLADSFPLGAAAARPRGTAGGSRKIIANNLPLHVHGMGHTHTVVSRTNIPASLSVPQTDRVSGGGGTSATENNTAVNSHSGNTADGGFSNTDYLPPYVALNFIIKT